MVFGQVGHIYFVPISRLVVTSDETDTPRRSISINPDCLIVRKGFEEPPLSSVHFTILDILYLTFGQTICEYPVL